MFRTALVGVGATGVTYPVLCVEPDPAGGRTGRRPKCIGTCLAVGASAIEHTRLIDSVPRIPRDFPVDVRHNAKIFREKLAAGRTPRWRWVRIPRDRPGVR